MSEHIFYPLNAGILDADNLHRAALEGMSIAAELQNNIFSTVTGLAFLRPGFEYLSTTESNNTGELLPFVAGAQSGFLIELTDYVLRVRDGSDDALVTRASVSTDVADGDFGAATGWTLSSDAGQTSQVTGGQLSLVAAARGALAKASQQVTVAGGDQGVEHALRIVVDRGPVTFRCGSSANNDDYVAETQLDAGRHSLAFTPTGDFYITFSTSRQHAVLVESCEVEASGVMEITTPWPAADLGKVRYEQSLDVMFVSCDGYRQQKIERRGDASWSVAEYHADDGPFDVLNLTNTKLTPSATEGNVTVTADQPTFSSSDVGALVRMYHEGQRIDTYVAKVGDHTPPIMVTGVNETNYNERDFVTTITGTWAGTLRHERSFDGEEVEFHPFRREQASSTIDITANAAFTNDDNEDNVIAWYRVAFSAYTSGVARVVITYDGGGGYGIGRITGYTSETEVSVEVLSPFFGITGSDQWQEGLWSPRNGYPAAVVMSAGRLFWLGADEIIGSISGNYYGFDETFPGDAAPINRELAIGGRNNAFWAVDAGDIIVGCDTMIARISPSIASDDNLLTAANIDVKSISQEGAYDSVSPLKLADERVIYVHADGKTLFEVSWVSQGTSSGHRVQQFSKLTTDIFENGIVDLAYQRRPDNRIYAAISNDSAVMITYDPVYKVAAHCTIQASDAVGANQDVIESFAVLPSSGQDRVYAIIKRIVDGNTVRYVEKLALDSEAKPRAIAKCVDSFVLFGSGSATISGLDHLEGRTVVAWYDSAPDLDENNAPNEYTVSGGQITLGGTPSVGGVVGLPYTGRLKTGRILDQFEGGGSTLHKRQSVKQAGFLLSNYVRSSVKYGTEFDNASHPFFNLPAVDTVTGTDAPNVVTGAGGTESMVFVDGSIEHDTRLCIELASPSPCTIRAIAMEVANP